MLERMSYPWGRQIGKDPDRFELVRYSKYVDEEVSETSEGSILFSRTPAEAVSITSTQNKCFCGYETWCDWGTWGDTRYQMGSFESQLETGSLHYITYTDILWRPWYVTGKGEFFQMAIDGYLMT